MAYTTKEIREKLPTGLSDSDKMALLIGYLIAAWAQCESIFFGLLACFIKGSEGQAQIAWLNINSSSARAYYVQRLAIASSLDRQIVHDIKQLVKDFKSLSKIRNMFCHAHYQGDPVTGDMIGLESFDLTDDERVFVMQKRKLDKALINECSEAIAGCSRLNDRLWVTLIAVRELTGSHHLTLPAELPAYLERRGVRPTNQHR